METSPKIQKERLIFDRRYGWVFDEWKDPSEEALSGGRGMFCIVPLAKGFVKTASRSINAAASSVIEAIERPELFSPSQLQANLSNKASDIITHLKPPNINSILPILSSFRPGMDVNAESCSTSQESKCS